MAYAAVASLSQTIHLIFNYHQDSMSPELKNRITSAHEIAIFLRSFLENFPDEANIWEERIRQVTTEAEDIIELLLSNSMLDSSKSKLKKRKHQLPHDLNDLERVIEEMESIVKGVKERHAEDVGGSNEDLTEIISRLVEGSSWREIIAIVGIGGIGKTTLARNVYNHPLIVKHFDIRAWATVSQDYSSRRIILGLLRFLTGLDSSYIYGGLEKEEVSIEYICRILSGKRYLIVLDDIWSLEAWESLKLAFPYTSNNGSRIMLTTRLSNLASYITYSIHIHEMCLLNVDQSWNMLRQKIFKGHPCPPKLEWMGKLIARSCRGLPLAIEVVSGIMAADQTVVVWEDIIENMKTFINCEGGEHILHILHLSYIYLPHHSRPCFLYLGIFPQDHKITVSKLIKLWEAEGFVNESESKSCEEMGEEFLEELVKRGLVSVSKRKSSHRMKKVGIHDLVWDFCTRQAQLDHFFLHVTKFLVAEAKATLPLQRRVSACFNIVLPNVNCSTIRTIICWEYKHRGIRKWLKYFSLLRILDLSEGYYLLLKWNELPNQVFEQFHLRYLALAVDRKFSGTIPKAILNLQNLHTLIIRPREYHRVHLELPVEIWSMPQLRHIVVLSCVLMLPPAREKGEARFALENLQTLNEVEDFICSREILEMIPNLKKLCIFCKGSVDNYELHNLIHFQKLEILKIKMNWPHLGRQRIILLAFPPTLKSLSLKGVGVPWEDMKIVGSLPNLQELQLRDDACVGGKWETNEGGFSQLNFLLIDYSDLEHWITETTHFPELKCLVLRRCSCLREIPNTIREIPTLEFVEFPVVAVKKSRTRHVFVHSYVLPNQEEEEEAVNLICSRENLKRIPNLKKLRLLYANWIDLEDEYELHNLIHLEKLEILEIHETFSECRTVNYLQELKFPHSIKELSLTMNNGFDWEDVLQNIGSLPVLLKLKLANGSFRRGKWEIAQGQFPCLKFLSLIGCRDLQQWTAAEERSMFPCLEQLRLYELAELKEIPREISTLQRIQLFYCSESVVMCAKRMADEANEFQISFHVMVVVSYKEKALNRLASPNFHVQVGGMNHLIAKSSSLFNV